MSGMRMAVAACCTALALATDVFVMLPLNTFKTDGSLQNKEALSGQLDKLKTAGADGFMVDLWWGITEPSAKSYNFGGAIELVQMAKDKGMKAQLVSSFHKCGGNVGDDCNNPLPQFVLSQPGIWYKGSDGREDQEYISLWADNVTIGGRTPIQMYKDWFGALLSALGDLAGSVSEVEVSMGPAGELRYPSYQLDRWQFCGIGEFQCYDDHALEAFQAAAKAAGHPEYDSPPKDAGSYNDKPPQAGFWAGGYSSDYGKFFLDWYFSSLKAHGKAVLGAAKEAFGDKLAISGKISGIHWWYKNPTHAAELTAGYYNVDGRDAYAEMAREVFKPFGARVDFTCMEMKDSEQSQDCASGPQELVGQVISATSSAGAVLSGENALPRYDTTAYGQIESYKSSLASFTYLRLNDQLLSDQNFGNFRDFVSNMHSGEAALIHV